MANADLSNTTFHGDGYDPSMDHLRLTGNLVRVRDYLTVGGVSETILFKKRTLHEISGSTNVPEASVSACLRTLRNEHGYVIKKERVKDGAGTWRYWIAGKGNPPAKKMKPVGDPALFGEMMRSIFAVANPSDELYEDALKELRWEMHRAAAAWCNDMVVRTKRVGMAEIVEANKVAAASEATREMELTVPPLHAKRRDGDA